MVSGSSLISGTRLNHTLLFSNVRVHAYAEMEDTVVLPIADIGRHARIKRAIVDRGCWAPERMFIDEDHEEDRRCDFRLSDGGVVLVTADMLGQSVHLMR